VTYTELAGNSNVQQWAKIIIGYKYGVYSPHVRFIGLDAYRERFDFENPWIK
jgi:hypothetical protein